jgi:hypothetical protein
MLLNNQDPPPHTYWVSPDLLAGRHPDKEHLGWSLNSGICHFVNLTAEGGLYPPYDTDLVPEANARSIEVTHRRAADPRSRLDYAPFRPMALLSPFLVGSANLPIAGASALSARHAWRS